MKKIVAGIVIVALVAAAIIYGATRNRSETDGGLKVSGTIEVTDVEVSFKIPGRVKERLVDEGQLVAAGQVVARLEDDDLRLDLAQREREVEAHAAQLRELETGFRKEEIAQADAAVNRVRAETTRLEADFARQEALFRREVISRRDYDAARAAHDAAQATLNEALARQELLHAGPRRETIAAARARLRQTEEARALSRTRLGYATVTVPLAGIVLSKNAEPGEQVAAGTPVVTVADIRNTWVRAYIAETDLGRVKVGQKAAVTSDTYPGTSYEGTVSFIAQEAEFTPKNVQTQKERVKLVYRIKITVPNPNGELKPGMPVDAEIATGDRGSGTGN